MRAYAIRQVLAAPRPRRSSAFVRQVLLPACVFAAGCSASERTEPEASQDPILGGQLARAYPEAALVDSDRGACSGAVIAPRVVLTAGHCIKGASRWKVTTPFAGGQEAASSGSWTSYEAFGGILNPRSVDVGLVILATPIELASYPALTTSAVSDGTRANNVGRVKNGALSSTSLFVGPEVRIGRGQPVGFPLSYTSNEVVESGDSGGPVYVKSASGSRTIVAVNSGAANGRQILAKIDLVREEIDRIVQENPPARE